MNDEDKVMEKVDVMKGLREGHSKKVERNFKGAPDTTEIINDEAISNYTECVKKSKTLMEKVNTISSEMSSLKEKLLEEIKGMTKDEALIKLGECAILLSDMDKNFLIAIDEEVKKL